MAALVAGVAMCAASPLAPMRQQNAPELARIDSIAAMPETYIYGLGHGDDEMEAYDAALHDMVRKISITVVGSTHSELAEGTAADGSDVSRELFSSVVDSYTTPASLEGVERIAFTDAAGQAMFVFMPRSEVERMHERRRFNVADLARAGIRARDRGKVDDALRSLYRAYVLLQSLPAPSDVREKVDGQERVLANWIPEAMRDIIGKVSFGIASVKKDPEAPEMGETLELNVLYDGRPATTCSFRYGTAFGYSPLVTARDGMAQIELSPKDPRNPLKLYVEYLFKDENHTDMELRPLLDHFKGAGLVDNRLLLNKEGKTILKADKRQTNAFQVQVASGAKEGMQTLSKKEAAKYAATVEKVIAAIRSRRYDSASDLFTEAGRKEFERLVSYGKASLLGDPKPDTYAFYPFRDEVVCRSIPMAFTFDGGRRKITEDVVLTLNSDAKVESVTFGLGSIARDEIFSKQGAAWTDDRKMVIAGFLENYRTAFALRELDYIESIFDDDAVIIVGHVSHPLRKASKGDAIGLASREQVTYARKSKKEYLEQLRRCFKAQEYISLRFSDTDIERSGVGGETYAIQLRQDYVSKTYGDQGYLFLFVDFNDEEHPLIHVRTWQPERNPDLTPNLPKDHPRAGIFSPASF